MKTAEEFLEGEWYPYYRYEWEEVMEVYAKQHAIEFAAHLNDIDTLCNKESAMEIYTEWLKTKL